MTHQPMIRKQDLFVAPESWMTTGLFMNEWPATWLRDAAGDVGIDTTGTKREVVNRIMKQIRRGNRRVISRFDRCS